MKRNELRAGQSYLAEAGGWVYEVQSINRLYVDYTVVQTGQKCRAKPANFAARVKRPVMLIDRPNRRR